MHYQFGFVLKLDLSAGVALPGSVNVALPVLRDPIIDYIRVRSLCVDSVTAKAVDSPIVLSSSISGNPDNSICSFRVTNALATIINNEADNLIPVYMPLTGTFAFYLTHISGTAAQTFGGYITMYVECYKK